MNPSSRALAVEVLAATERGESADSILAHLLRATPLSPGARARATALSYGALRLRNRCDFVLKPFLQRPLKQVSPMVRAALRVGIFELLWARQAEAFAVVHSLVELTRAQVPAASGFVNAVLRRVSEQANTLREPPAALRQDTARYLSEWESHPRWLVDRWLGRFGREQAERLCRMGNREPAVHLRVNPLRCDRERLLAALAEAGVAAEAGRLYPGCVRLRTPRAIDELPGYADGWFTVQDEGAMLIAAAGEPQPGQRVIDLCAAPGGKAGQMAELMGNQGELIACDQSAERLALVQETAQRCGLSIVHCEVGEGQVLAERLAPADLVLVDAPCSGTGTLARRADLRWRLRPFTAGELAAGQRELLEAAARLVRPGGLLVYATCSLEREENEAVMAWFDESHPGYTPDGAVSAPPPGWEFGQAMTTIVPAAEEDHDGFFLARRRRRP